MKRRVLGFALALTVCASAISLTACGNNASKEVSETQTVESSKVDDQNKYDPFGKYNEPVTVTAVLSYANKTDPKIPNDITPENQAFVKVAKEKLNIDLKFMWIAPANQFEQKFGVAMASGELPDILNLNPTNFESLKANGQLADLTEAYKYAGGKFKEYVERDKSLVKLGEADGKLYAIPRYNDPRREMNMMFIRQDWLKNVGMDIPKTTDDLRKVAKAFTENDPDKNSKKDTVGLGISKDVSSWGFDIKGVMNSFGSYPMKWLKGSDGKLIPGEIQPDTKKALEFLQAMYKEGSIDKEFVMKDANKIAEDAIAGKIGILYGPWWLYEWPLNLNKDKQNNAEWVCTQIPGTAGQEGKALVERISVYEYRAVNKDCKNPEAVIKLYNLYCDFESNEEKYGKLAMPEGGNVWNWVPTFYADPNDINSTFEKLNKALDSNDESMQGFVPSEKIIFNNYKEYNQFLSGNGKWDGGKFGSVMARASKNGGWGVTREISGAGNVVYNEFYGVATQGQQDKGASLDKMTSETFLKIITNAAPVSDFDKYITNWNKLGGEQITKEINEWYEKNSK